MVEAERLHELEFGPEVFQLRMKGFVQEQGWHRIWELFESGK